MVSGAATCAGAATGVFIASLSGEACGLGRAGRNRQHLEARFGDQYRMLPLRGEAMVLGDNGPAVGELADARLAGIDHRLDGEGHARLQPQTGLRAAIVQHLRLFVEFAADAMAAELAHDTEAVPLGM